MPHARRNQPERDPFPAPHGEPDRIAAALQEVGERRRHGHREAELRSLERRSLHAARATRSEIAARVEHDECVELGLGLLPPDDQAIAARVHVPVEIAQVVAGRVLLVVGELDVRRDAQALVASLAEAERRFARLEVEVLEASEDLRVPDWRSVRTPRT